MPTRNNFNAGDALNALSLSPDQTQVVVAGRNILKILDIHGTELSEKINLRTGRTANTNTSSNDVKWNPQQAFQHYILTSSTNGAVLLWNMTPQAPRTEKVASEHTRTVNHVCWHPSDGNIFISGSQDGTVKLWDVRDLTKSRCTFECRADNVRDIQFNPFNHSLFAAGFENSILQIWDIRKQNAPEKQLNACQSPILAIDWHPEDPYVIASGGRDNTIKTWNINNISKHTHSIQTAASVCHIQWRPSCRSQIASSALLLDFSIHTWDINRPYIPRFSMTELKDVTTGFLWMNGNDGEKILSCSKDGVVKFHPLATSYRPYEHIRSACLSWSPASDLVSITEKIDRRAQSNLQPPQQQAITSPTITSPHVSTMSSPVMEAPPRIGKVYVNVYSPVASQSSSQSQPQQSSSLSLSSPSSSSQSAGLPFFDRATFQYLAQHYVYEGMSLSELCLYNADVAANAQLNQIEQTWRMINTLYSNEGFTKIVNITADDELEDEKADDDFIQDMTRQNAALGDEHNTTMMDSAGPNMLDEGAFDLDSDNLFNQQRMNHLIPHEDVNLDETENEGFAGHISDDILPNDIPTALADDPTVDSSFEGMFSISPVNSRPPSPSMQSPDDLKKSKHFTFHNSLPVFDQEPVILELLEFFADQGDVQNCVAIALVLDKRINISSKRVELWVLEYIELLQRFELWTIAGEMIRTSKFKAVQAMSMTSTTIHTGCGQCQKPLIKSGWYCERCSALTNTCSVCHQIAKGLYSWCQGCGHGGHSVHLQEWFSKYAVCPAVGCGHVCNLRVNSVPESM